MYYGYTLPTYFWSSSNGLMTEPTDEPVLEVMFLWYTCDILFMFPQFKHLKFGDALLTHVEK